jgi:acyl-CoA reductase-like NAD-dependent aldehyde dehydrogenase
MSDPLEQGEWSTLEAELRQALQHQKAAYEQMMETQREVEELLARARKALEARKPEPSEESQRA